MPENHDSLPAFFDKLCAREQLQARMGGVVMGQFTECELRGDTE